MPLFTNSKLTLNVRLNDKALSSTELGKAQRMICLLCVVLNMTVYS